MKGSDSTAAAVMRALQQAGYRATSPRRAVVQAVAGRRRHFTGAEILAEVAGADGSVGRATVFRTLEVLVELGLIGRVLPQGGGQAYVLCSQDHHHHAICSRCGLVLELPGCPLDLEAEKDARTAGFWLHGHRLEFYGICQACQEKGGN